MADGITHPKGDGYLTYAEEFRKLIASWIGMRTRGGRGHYPLQDSDFAAADAVMAESRFHSLATYPPGTFIARGVPQLMESCSALVPHTQCPSWM